MQVRYEITEAITDVVHVPIDPKVFSVPVPHPAVVVSVASVAAQCRAANGCAYAASQTLTPTVSEVSVSALQVTIAGAGLLPSEVAGGVAAPGGEGWLRPVEIGSTPCAESERSDVSITCTLAAPLPPGTNAVKVCCDGPPAHVVSTLGTCLAAWAANTSASAPL